jgi:hypothetical protein
MSEPDGDAVVPVREDVRLDEEVVAHDALEREAASIDRRQHAVDDDASAAFGWQVPWIRRAVDLDASPPRAASPCRVARSGRCRRRERPAS